VNPDSVRFGWTLTDLDKLARSVVSGNRAWWPAGDRDDLYAAAWHGIVERLCEADEPPHRVELMEAGRRALAADVRDSMRHHGARTDGTNTGQKFAMYWGWYGRTTPSPENSIVERLTLEQIWPTLTTGQQQALLALAATGDYQQAGLLTGSHSSLKSQLMKGRRRYLALWHEGEKPSRPWGCDRRAGATAGTEGIGESAIARMRRRARARTKNSTPRKDAA
jgi:hypothetical protein